MKKNHRMFSRSLKLFFLLSSLLLMRGSYLTGQSFKLNEVTDLVRVFEDSYKMPATHDTIKVFGIHGEIVSGQFIINAKKSLTNVTVDLSTLKTIAGGSDLRSDAVEWNFVGSIPLTKNTPNQPVSALTRKAPARFPDYLMAEKQIDIKANSVQPVWLTFRIPATAASGTYTGRITVKCGTEQQSLPVYLTIYPLTMPVARHLKVVEWYNTGAFSRFHGITEAYSPAWFGMLKKYADNMVEHRQNTFRVDMDVIDIQRASDGSFTFDFTRFDQIAQVFWNTGKMDFLETGFLADRGEKGWADTQFRWQELNVKKSGTGEQVKLPGKDVIPYLVPAFETHLRQKGWLKKTWFHIQDEPAIHNALSWIEFSRFIHKYGPDFVRIDAIENTFLLTDIDIAVPKLDHFANWYDTYKKWAGKGHELWFYSVGIFQGSLFPNKTIDVALSDSRIMHWLNYKYDATGYLHWGWNQWNEDPYKAYDENIGDAWHVYPVKDGVLNSLRWEEMRNGIQDYEYFWMLENKVRELKDSLGSRFSWIDPKQRGKEIASEVVKGFADRSAAPEVLYGAKKKIINELLDFNSFPGLYVQTNPPEGTLVTSGSSIEVFGWTEPGTKIIVNGQELPVSQQGLFVEQFQLAPQRNIIKVQASGIKGPKEIIRSFEVR